MVITLLMILLIASLLFFVFNTGKNVQGRIVTQNAADATAIGGASQVARSLNTIAMNNVESARIIAAINVLDSIPLAVDLSVTDETESGLGDLDAIAQAVQAQIRAGVVDPWFEHKLQTMIDPAAPDGILPELFDLRELDQLFREQPNLVPEMTHYRAPSGEMGRMHHALRSMDIHSRAVMETLSEAVRLAASKSGLVNTDTADADAMILPFEPTIPWRRGVFADYERPVRFGLLPGTDRRLRAADSNALGLGQIDTRRVRRGPWDVLFGWRFTNGSDVDPGRVPSDGGTPPLSGRSTPAIQPTYYGVYGTTDACLHAIPTSRYARIRNIDSPVYSRGHLTDLVYVKGAYLWEQRPLSRIRDTQWEIDIEHDNERSNDRNQDCLNKMQPAQFMGSLFVVVEIKSRLAGEKGLLSSRGVSWNYIDAPGRQSPYVIYRGDWFDPDRMDGYRIIRHLSRNVKHPPKWRKIQDYVWRISTVYRTDPDGPDLGGDLSIGLPPKQIGSDANGNPVYMAQEVYWEIDVMLVGANIGKEIVVDNPWVGFDRNSIESPAPIDLNLAELPENNAEARWKHLTFLGIVRQSNRSPVWSSQFDNKRPYPYNTGIAQAHVFNNHSWDLWTQTWQAQLEPIDIACYGDWVDLSEQAIHSQQSLPELNNEELESMVTNLRNIEKLAPSTLKH